MSAHYSNVGTKTPLVSVLVVKVGVAQFENILEVPKRHSINAATKQSYLTSGMFLNSFPS